MDELQVQRELTRDASADGAFAFKANNRFLVGVPDLFLQYPDLPALWLEVKYERTMRRDGFARLDLTPKQRSFIVRMMAAGGRAAWLLVVRVSSRGDYLLAYGYDPDVVHVDMRAPGVLERNRGAIWPITQVVRGLAGS